MKQARVVGTAEPQGVAAFLKANAARMAMIAVLLGAAGAVFYFNRGPVSPLSDHISFVCVSTGKVFELPRGTTRIMPFRNPETGQDTLFPCAKREDGKFYVSGRYREGIGRMGELNRRIDPKTLELKPLQE